MDTPQLTREQMYRQTLRRIAQIRSWSCDQECGSEHDPECPVALAAEVLVWDRAVPV